MRMLIVFTLLLGCAAVAVAAGAATRGLSREAAASAAATPSPDATQPVTLTATPSLPPVTAAVESSPTATPTPAAANFTLSGRLVVDTNANGVADATDAAPAVVYLDLVPWSTADQLLEPITGVPPVVTLYSAPDGSFAFDRLPPDSYTLEIAWPFGFETKGTIAGVREWLRAAFRVTEKGEIVPPNPLPKVWPGSLVPFVPEEPILGAIPNPILLKKAENPNIVTVPVLDGGAGPPPVGRVDVSAVLGRTPGPVRLPSTGAASADADGWRGYLALTAGAMVALALAVALVRRARN